MNIKQNRWQGCDLLHRMTGIDVSYKDTGLSLCASVYWQRKSIELLNLIQFIWHHEINIINKTIIKNLYSVFRVASGLFLNTFIFVSCLIIQSILIARIYKLNY